MVNKASRVKKRWPEDDIPPPKISQNHYRHIHEQRDFTLENLSMAGETDKEDYTDLRFDLEFDWQQDDDIQDIQTKKEKNAPYYRFKVIDEERKKRKEQNNQKAQDLYGNFMNKDVVHGFNEQDALLLQ